MSRTIISYTHNTETSLENGEIVVRKLNTKDELARIPLQETFFAIWDACDKAEHPNYESIKLRKLTYYKGLSYELL